MAVLAVAVIVLSVMLEMMGTGMHFFEDIITYNGTPGYRYFVDAFCYAGDKTGYDEKAYSSVVKTAVR